MSDIRKAMPALFRHQGIWEGTYRTVTVSGKEVDFHHSRIIVSFPAEGPHAYLQQNTFWWPDGRRMEALHPGSYRDGKLWWDTDLIRGHAFQGDDRTCILTWTRNDTPDAHLYELIAISEDNQTRARTWHWFRGGAVYQRTLVDERRVG